jgi:ectoine hydroxylase-related dioxygenase (phytanoyl-CoA dioxygenase family)
MWASHFISQKPTISHHWHLDVEFGPADGATIWLGLKNLNEKTEVSVISHSHKLGTVPQELRGKTGLNAGDNQAVLAAAKKIDPRCEIKTFYLKPGEFIIWSGKAWHTTINRSETIRSSIIFQYCTPENAMKIPENYEYPNTKWLSTQPPCVLVSGEDTFHRNKVFTVEEIKLANKFLRPVYSSAMKLKRFVSFLKHQVSPGSLHI